jgi:outer membrane protein assembly factor BamB
MTAPWSRIFILAATCVVSISIHASLSAAPADWPQWRGPERTGVSKETGLLQKWPEAGPKLLWTSEGVGDGFATVAVVGGRLYTQGKRDEKNFVIALDVETGKEVWSVENGPGYSNSYGDGPRGTPTVEGDVLYALGAEGDLACLEIATGKSRWTLNLLKEFGGKNTHWGLSESPLIVGKLLLCTPGGKDATIAALDKTNGKAVWTSKGLSDPPAYSSLITFEAAGVPQVVNVTAKGIAGVALEDGRFLWRYDRAANGTANIATPIYSDGHVFVTSDYGTGCALLKLKPDGEADGKKKVAVEEVYFTRDLKNHHGGVVLVKDHLYGYSSEILTCLEWKTGKVAWRDRSVGKGSVVYADGCIYAVGEKGKIGLVKATPEKYEELGRFEIEHGKQNAWAHPVVSGGRLYVRTQNKVRCYEVKASSESKVGG